jgi:hypothetical protein
MYIWEQKLNLVKYSLKDWAKTLYVSPTVEKQRIKSKIMDMQRKMETKEITQQIQKE